mmetsp:Transcript_3248/g.8142  ORF Transcript_3248/g.8142 Transcript_3248/m.8142 type:complete len:255 (+) Transcript_3248:176-940(+)
MNESSTVFRLLSKAMATSESGVESATSVCTKASLVSSLYTRSEHRIKSNLPEVFSSSSLPHAIAATSTRSAASPSRLTLTFSSICGSTCRRSVSMIFCPICAMMIPSSPVPHPSSTIRRSPVMYVESTHDLSDMKLPSTSALWNMQPASPSSLLRGNTSPLSPKCSGHRISVYCLGTISVPFAMNFERKRCSMPPTFRSKMTKSSLSEICLKCRAPSPGALQLASRPASHSLNSSSSGLRGALRSDPDPSAVYP